MSQKRAYGVRYQTDKQSRTERSLLWKATIVECACLVCNHKRNPKTSSSVSLFPNARISNIPCRLPPNTPALYPSRRSILQTALTKTQRIDKTAVTLGFRWKGAVCRLCQFATPLPRFCPLALHTQLPAPNRASLIRSITDMITNDLLNPSPTETVHSTASSL